MERCGTCDSGHSGVGKYYRYAVQEGKIKALLLIDHLDIAGAIRWIVDMGNALVCAGHEVYIGTESGKPCEWLPVLPWVVKWDKLPFTRCDLVLTANHTRPTRQVAEGLDARVRIYWCVGMHEPEADEILTAVDDNPISFREVVTEGKYHILTCSTWIKDWIAKNLNPDVGLLLPGVNHTIFHPVRGARRPGELKIISSGKFRECEGSISVAKAVDIIKQTYPAARLETYYRKGLPQSEMARFYASGAIWLDGQWWGGLALAPTEAMACGTPVVCTDIGANADVCIDGQNCLKVPVENPEAMAGAALKLLDNEDMYHQFILAGYTAIKRMVWSKTVRNLEQYWKGWVG